MLIRVSPALYTFFVGLFLYPAVAGQQPVWMPFPYRHPYTTIDDMLNKDAQASDPVSIHYYGEDMAHLIVPDQAGADYINSFADRVAKAEEAAREGERKLVPEADVVRAFNDLMRQIGAPPSFRAKTDTLQKFRAHAAAVRALPAVITEARNDTNCYPGEAVYLLWVLLITDGAIPEHYLDDVEALGQWAGRGGGSAAAAQSSELKMKALSFLVAYETNHPRRETTKLFNRVAKNLDL